MNYLKTEQKWSKSEPMFEHHRSNASGIEKKTVLYYPPKMPHVFFWIVSSVSSPPKYCQNPRRWKAKDPPQQDVVPEPSARTPGIAVSVLRWSRTPLVKYSKPQGSTEKVDHFSGFFWQNGFDCSIFVGNSYYILQAKFEYGCAAWSVLNGVQLTEWFWD